MDLYYTIQVVNCIIIEMPGSVYNFILEFRKKIDALS